MVSVYSCAAASSPFFSLCPQPDPRRTTLFTAVRRTWTAVFCALQVVQTSSVTVQSDSAPFPAPFSLPWYSCQNELFFCIRRTFQIQTNQKDRDGRLVVIYIALRSSCERQKKMLWGHFMVGIQGWCLEKASLTALMFR